MQKEQVFCLFWGVFPSLSLVLLEKLIVYVWLLHVLYDGYFEGIIGQFFTQNQMRAHLHSTKFVVIFLKKRENATKTRKMADLLVAECKPIFTGGAVAFFNVLHWVGCRILVC